MKEIYELPVKLDISSVKDELKDLFSGGHINFLLGAGFSYGILSTLGNYEYILEGIRTYIAVGYDNKNKYQVLKAYMFWGFFTKCVYPIVDNVNDSIMKKYVEFADNIYRILADKGNPTLNRQCNIFTTNYDPINELAFDNSTCICNDGFEGRIDPIFSTDNFSKIYYREALFSNRKAEIPSVNLLKIHGSVTWKYNKDKNRVEYQDYRLGLKHFSEKYSALFDIKLLSDLEDKFISVTASNAIDYIDAIVNDTILDSLISHSSDYVKMLEDYSNTVLIVNPTKEKFSSTLLNKNYYELLRMYTNELEKENAVLLVFGFSFLDEHILDLTKRSLVNPSLKLIIFCYKEDNIKNYKKLFGDLKNNNVSYVYIKDGALSINEFNTILDNIHA